MALAFDLTQIGIPAREADFLGDTQTDNITLTGTVQADGYQIVNNINGIVGGTAVTAIALVLPLIRTFKNSFVAVRSDYIGFAAQLFPAVGDSINGLAVNVAFPIVAGTGVLCFKVGATRWIVMGSAT